MFLQLLNGNTNGFKYSKIHKIILSQSTDILKITCHLDKNKIWNKFLENVRSELEKIKKFNNCWQEIRIVLSVPGHTKLYSPRD